MARAFSAVMLLVWKPMNGLPAASFSMTGLRCFTSCAESVPDCPASPIITNAMCRYLMRLALVMSFPSAVFSRLLLDGEPRLHVGDRAVDLAEPMRRAGRQNDEIARLDVPRHAALDPRGSILSACKCSAGHERAGPADDVVDLGHIVMRAGIVRTFLPAPDNDLAGARIDDRRHLPGDNAECGHGFIQ